MTGPEQNKMLLGMSDPGSARGHKVTNILCLQNLGLFGRGTDGVVAVADVRDEEHEVAVEVERPVLAMSVVEAALALRHAGLALGRERVALLEVAVGLHVPRSRGGDVRRTQG